MNEKINELKDIQKLDKKIEHYYQQLDDIESTYLPSKSLYTEKVQTSGISDICFQIASAVEETAAVLLQLIEEALAKRTTIISKLDQIDNQDEADILYYRYVKGEKYENLAPLLGVSEATSSRLLRRAEKSYSKIA